MTDQCTWPAGTCQCMMAQQGKPDPYGRVWMHCESGLSFTKASVTRFVMFCLGNNVEIGEVRAFNPKYPGCLLLATVRIRPDQITAFEAETGGKLTEPPKITLNSQSGRAALAAHEGETK